MIVLYVAGDGIEREAETEIEAGDDDDDDVVVLVWAVYKQWLTAIIGGSYDRDADKIRLLGASHPVHRF
jgi:hypothetical protein